LVAVLAIVASVTAAVASNAGAQVLTASADLIGITENQWIVAYNGGFECPGADPVVTAADVDGVPVDIVSQAPETAGSVALFLPPDALAGFVTFTIECATIAPNATEAGDDYSSIAIEKVVSGPVPVDATFTVNVDCDGAAILSEGWNGDEVAVEQDPDPFSVDLEYGPEGGVGYVYTDFFRECVVTEPNTGGATTTTLDIPEDLYVSPINYFGTVTNTFPVVPVVVVPTFTG
jgi:hypothetical protein